MEALKFIKEEPVDTEYYESNSEYYDALNSYSTFKSEQLCEIKVENNGEFCKTEESCQDSWRSTSSDHPKLSVPLVRLEYSQNQEVRNYLQPLLPEITSSIEPRLGKDLTSSSVLSKNFQLNLNLKTESVELETLTEGTLIQSPTDYDYASPWNFVSVPDVFNENSSGINNNIPEKILKKEYADRTRDDLITYEPYSPRHASNIQDMGTVKKQFTQQTLKFEVVAKNRSANMEEDIEAPVKSNDCDVTEHTGKLEPPFSQAQFHRRKTHFCKLCNHYFVRNSNLVRHMITKHSNKNSEARKAQKTLKPTEIVKKFICDICGKPFEWISQLIRHCDSHDVSKWYECDMCKKKFKMKAYLSQHIRRHEWEQHPCNYCPKLYRRKSTLQRHAKIHTAEDMTKKCTPQTEKLEPKKSKGLTSHSTKSPITAVKLKNDHKADTKPSLKLQYECDVCGIFLEDKSSLQVHIEFLHVEIFGDCNKEIGTSRLTKSSLKRRFRCHVCNKRYIQSCHLRRHERTHFSRKSYSCEMCDQHFSRMSSLSRHLLYKHDEIRTTRKNAGKKVKKTFTEFMCKICDKAFKNLPDLRRHCAIHDARKPYECDVCKKQFAVKGYLYAHILTHDNWKPYPCQSCPKFYKRKSSLKRHIEIKHTAKKKY